ncbi:MAG: hypothetical protein KKI08_09685, partial [Armatimonadetes bacterium]|nr:hypothetical protein [Armatimonadota bacterium]
HCYGYPYGDTIRNNVFAYSAEGQLMRNANHEPDEGLHARIERNIVYNRGPRTLWGSNWAPESKFAADRNCYFSEATAAPDFNGKTFAQWQATGRDVNSIVADPGFVNARGFDFRLKPDSPALKLGYKPIDLSTVGLEGPAAWKSLPLKIVHRAVEQAPPPDPAVAGLVVADFEEYEPGDTPTGAVAAEGATSATVTDQQPAEGMRCLRLVDGPAKDVWRPHWFARRTPDKGAVHMQCSVRNDAAQPVSFDLEFRDWPATAGVKYATGPHLRFQPEGVVEASDGGQWKEIGRYRLGEWLKVQINLTEGEGRPNAYTVTLGVNGTPVAGLRFASEAFTNCNWVGLAGMDVKPGVFYADEIRVQSR